MINSQELTGCNLDQVLNPEELDMLYQYSTVLRFYPDDVIIKQGKLTNGLYYLLEGFALVTARVASRGYITLEKRGPGDFFGEISFIEKMPSPKSIFACDVIKCLWIPDAYIDFLTRFHPETKFRLYEAMIKQVYFRTKLLHDKMVSIIARSTMLTQPHFLNLTSSLTKLSPVTFEEEKIDVNQIYKFPLFVNMRREEIDILIQECVLLKVSKNCILIQSGECIPTCYIPIQGAVQSSIIHENKNAKLSVMGPGILFANFACVDTGMSFDITFMTCEKTLILKLSDRAIDHIKKYYQALWHRLFTKICRSLIELEKSIYKLEIRLNTEVYNR